MQAAVSHLEQLEDFSRAPVENPPEVGPIVTAADNYCRLCIWRQQHTPWLLRTGGAAIFCRLMAATQPLCIRDLIIAVEVSASQAWAVLGELHRRGLVSISGNLKDGSEHVGATDLLRHLARCYVQTMDHLLK